VEDEALPAGQRPNILAKISDTVAPVTSSSYLVNTPSVTDPKEKPLLTRFLASMLAANKALLNPKYKTCSIQAIKQQLNVTLDVATKEYASAIDKLTGEISPDGAFAVNSTGVANDVAVRDKFGGFAAAPKSLNLTAATQPGPGQLIDYTIKNAAVQQLQQHPLPGNCTQCDPLRKRSFTER
jgi:hypothetical protein